MDPTILAGVSLVSATIAAVGAPGVTFWVMRKMTANFMIQNKEHCAKCKEEINRRLDDHDEKNKQIEGRQTKLREEVLPSLRENFAKKEDLDKATGEIKENIRIGMEKVSTDIREVHGRIDGYFNGGKGGPG